MACWPKGITLCNLLRTGQSAGRHSARDQIQNTCHEVTVFPYGKHDDQVDSTAQFLDWFKRPFPAQGWYELARMRAEELAQHNRPEPAKINWAKGSMEWQAEQEALKQQGLPYEELNWS